MKSMTYENADKQNVVQNYLGVQIVCTTDAQLNAA